MIRFLLGALLVNGAALAAFVLLRHRVARWPQPGLWWLGAALLAILLTLRLAEATLL